ncbi:MAG: DUF302 domain-containing protein [Gammaproteobacteria bacterium]|nr:DUF302 domain-containing protein [Gammaproteobacteria bacterium]
MKKSSVVWVLGFIGLLLSNICVADTLLMARTEQSFPEAMLKLQETIKNQGYTVSRVQRIDIGLTASGYQTDKYRVVFFGKHKEITDLSERYPHMIPYLPLQIAIFAEEEETLLVAASPRQLEDENYPELNQILEKFEQDMQAIFSAMRDN